MFEINQKVVCIDDAFGSVHRRHIKEFPIIGNIYTIRDIIPAQEANGSETAAVLLHEIVNPPSPIRPEWGECGFMASRFREIEDMDQAEEMHTAEKLTYTN